MGVELWAYLWSQDSIPDVRCTVDGTEEANQPAPESDDDVWLDWRIIYNSNISKGNHTIHCDVLSASDDAPFFLKDFVIHPSELPQLIVGSVSGSLVSSEPDSVTTHTSGSSATATPTQVAAASKAKAPVGAIVGGVLGGLALIALVVLALELFLRRKRQSRYAQVGGYDDDGV